MTDTTTPAPTPTFPRPTLWTKIRDWVTAKLNAAEVVLAEDEKELLALLAPLFANAESAALQDLVTFVRGVLVTMEDPSNQTLEALERIVMNGLSKLGSSLQPVAIGLGSSALQALIGLVLASLPKPVQQA